MTSFSYWADTPQCDVRVSPGMRPMTLSTRALSTTGRSVFRAALTIPLQLLRSRRAGAMWLICALAALTFSSACQTPQSPRPQGISRALPGDALPAEPRIYAYANRPLLLPLTPGRGVEVTDDRGVLAAWRPGRAPIVEYESGIRADARLVYLEANSNPSPAGTWLPASVTWTTTDWADTQDLTWKPGGGGFWAMVVPPPPDGRRQILRFNGSTLPVLWLPSPPSATDAARAPRLDLDRTALRALGERIFDAARDPLQAWRIRILADRLRPVDLWGTAPLPPQDPVLALLADQTEARWRSAIGVLEREDPELAMEFVARLTAVVRLPQGSAFPAWPPEGSDLTGLRSALLTPSGTRSSRIDAVRTWLSSTPEGIAWIADASAPGVSHGEVASRRVTITIANLTSRETVASSAPLGKSATNAARLPAHSAAVFTCDIEEVENSPISGVVARVGGWSATLPVYTRAIPATPPGLLMGPLLPRWDMLSWRAGRPTTPHPGAAAVTMIQRSSTERDRWEVYVESSGANDGDVVSLWFGPYGNPVSVARVGPGAPQGPTIRREGQRWWTLVEIPQSAIDDRLRVSVGVMRRTAEGAVWSWPRPTGPDQTEPARAVVDLSQWGSLSESRTPSTEPTALSAARLDSSEGVTDSVSAVRARLSEAPASSPR